MQQQDATKNNPARKPKISESGINPAEPAISGRLRCQVVPEHYKPSFRPNLPKNMVLVPETTTDELDIQGAREAAKKREFLINLVRNGTHDDSPLIWAAFHALVSSKNVPIMRVGFVPVVPYPITQRSVVRKCMTNFVSVCQQLEQDVLPLWSDEGVFNIVVDIFLHEPETFKTLFPCMGPFHWSRVLLRCAGKLLKGTGFDDAMVECDVFGQVDIESALNGTHYARA